MTPSKFVDHFEASVVRIESLIQQAKRLELCDIPDIGLIDCVNRLNRFITAAKLDIDAEHQCCPVIAAQVAKWECDREDAGRVEEKMGAE